MAAELTDGPLAVSQRRFIDAVSAFCERQPVWDRGACRWASPLYLRVRGALTGTAARYGHRTSTSRPPARAAVLSYLCQVDQEVARWGPGAGTVDRLKGMAARSWRPQDCERLDGYTERLEQWTVRAAELLGDAPVTVPLRGHSCPACGRSTAVRRRRDGGETVRSAALVVSELGAQCIACGARWETSQLEFLAKLLNCQPLPRS